MVKVVENNERICTVNLDGPECSIVFQSHYKYFTVKNESDSEVYISLKRDIVPEADGVMTVNSKESATITNMQPNVNMFFASGSGKIQVFASNSDNFVNPFKSAPAAGGGGTIDAYTKTESDAKYAQKTDIPSSLPANGGNADTVGGVGIANLRQITQTVINTLPAVPNGEGDFLVNCDTSDTSFPYWYGHLSIRYGSYTGEYVAIFRTTGNDNKVYYNTYLTNHWSGWQEISATPIKSTTFSGTTNSYGDMLLFNKSEKKSRCLFL